MKRILSIFFCVVLVSANAWCQTDSLKNKLTFSLNFLTHGETCGGGLPRSVDKDEYTEDRSHFLLGRTRLIADYERSGLQAHVIVQNKAVWGASNNKDLRLYEAWVKMSARNGLFAQVGRVALSYDDERIIGPNDFAMAASSHDVLRVGYEGHGHKIHALFAYNQNDDDVYSNTYYDNGAQYYKTMQTLWYHYDVPKFPLGASLLFINMGLQAGVIGKPNNPPSTKYQQMFGGYINYHPKYLTLEGSYYRQTGKMVNEAMRSMPIRAWMASGKATFTPSDKYSFNLGYDYLSGDDYVPVPYGGTLGMVWHPVEKGFAPLNGSRTKFYGIMDFFYESAYINGFTPGLQNAFVGASVTPVEKLTCQAAYHYLAVATKLSKLKRALGHSVELEADYKFSKDISLSVAYTQMMGTETMSRLKQQSSGKHARWAWFSLVISPSLFTTRW